MYAAIRFAATFHDGVESLLKKKTSAKTAKISQSGCSAFKETEGRKHGMVRGAEVKTKFQGIRCVMRRACTIECFVCVTA